MYDDDQYLQNILLIKSKPNYYYYYYYKSWCVFFVMACRENLQYVTQKKRLKIVT